MPIPYVIDFFLHIPHLFLGPLTGLAYTEPDTGFFNGVQFYIIQVSAEENQDSNWHIENYIEISLKWFLSW